MIGNKTKYYFETEWDYNGWKGSEVYFGNETDWNITLITKINESRANLFQASPVGFSSRNILSHISLKFLFKGIREPQYLENFTIEFTDKIEEDTLEISKGNKIAKIKILS